MNNSSEASKTGFAVDEVVDFIESIDELDHLRVVGLMTMAPYETTEAEIASQFNELADLQREIQSIQMDQAPCHYLSMGMTNDYPIALRSGSTHIRVGRALFEGIGEEYFVV